MKTSSLSKSQVDKLGERLKNAQQISEADLRLLDAYRQTFSSAYDFVMRSITAVAHLKPSGRDAKSTMAIIDKLKRESIRLTQIQDIAGCRIVVDNIKDQEELIKFLCYMFQLGEDSIKDRRVYPSYGYRAVHLIIVIDKKPIEIQVRTKLQHIWAQISEMLSDRTGVGLKYGDGNQSELNLLHSTSMMVALIEEMEHDKYVSDTVEYSLESFEKNLRRFVEKYEDNKVNQQKMELFFNRVTQLRSDVKDIGLLFEKRVSSKATAVEAPLKMVYQILLESE